MALTSAICSSARPWLCARISGPDEGSFLRGPAHTSGPDGLVNRVAQHAGLTADGRHLLKCKGCWTKISQCRRYLPESPCPPGTGTAKAFGLERDFQAGPGFQTRPHAASERKNRKMAGIGSFLTRNRRRYTERAGSNRDGSGRCPTPGAANHPRGWK